MKTRTEYMLQALGYQGGTVHDLCRSLGIEVNEFLYSAVDRYSQEYVSGLYWDTNSKEFQRLQILPAKRGVVQYWLGVVACIHLSETIENKACKG